MRYILRVDPDFGAIAAILDDAGNIAGTASAGHTEDGTYMAVDEAALFEATGQLLPPPPLPEFIWDRAVDE